MLWFVLGVIATFAALALARRPALSDGESGDLLLEAFRTALRDESLDESSEDAFLRSFVDRCVAEYERLLAARGLAVTNYSKLRTVFAKMLIERGQSQPQR